MRNHNSPRNSLPCGLLLLNVFLFTAAATGQVLRPSAVNFGSVPIGSSASQSVALQNTGKANLTISQATISGTGFSISGLNLPLTLVPSQSVTFTTIFSPQSSGSVTGSLSLEYYRPGERHHSHTVALSLSGTGATSGQLAANPSSLNFGNVVVGSNAALNGSLTASGASVTINSASLNNGEFVLSGISLPATLAAGQSATFTVTFTPQASGATSASLTFSSNASNSPTTETMTGTGTAPTPHAVDLTWNAASGAVGYNIYRSTASGGPYTMINTALDSTTSYADSTVVSGQTYYYVATTVNSESEESGYSNQVQAVIPTP